MVNGARTATGKPKGRGAEPHHSPLTIYYLLFTNYQLPITNYQLPITNYQLPITNYQLPITNYQYQLPITAND